MTTAQTKTPQLNPIWGPWQVASGAGGKRTWWIRRENTAPRIESPNGAVYHYETSDEHLTASGALRRYMTMKSAQTSADNLNK